MRTTIKDALASDNKENAHDPLHDIGHELEEVSPLAKKEGMPAADQTAIDAAVEELMDAYTEVDKTFHGNGEIEYSAVETKIDAAIKTLQSKVKPAKG